MLPDDPVVEKATRAQLDGLRPHIVSIDEYNVTLTQRGFDMLLEYITSVPTGIADGKVWKSQIRDGSWVMQEYVDKGRDSHVSVTRRKIRVV